MRYFLIALAWLIAVPAASAAEWQTYSNARFGYRAEVPPGFRMARAPDNDDGRTFTGPNGDRILVFGTNLLDTAFEGEASNRIAQAMDDGWQISYSRVEADWASYSGTNGSRILYVRGVQLCDEAAAFVMLEYRSRDLKAYDAIVKRMVASLKPVGCAR
ncbi:hypothetical protein PMI07_003101 [Rhizobium sp. CF080]|uniref:hypothetical protein n=1 Tax=Rhizobium sp. (strain CF080) TaxID=1144310 RepID=UPI00027180CD|nr:hypothetical protein [Rhizobium sp. CF080]EUB95323.1 hypothetical protein PMI07_003101 [Rhizobium sp. CF080]